MFGWGRPDQKSELCLLCTIVCLFIIVCLCFLWLVYRWWCRLLANYFFFCKLILFFVFSLFFSKAHLSDQLKIGGAAHVQAQRNKLWRPHLIKPPQRQRQQPEPQLKVTSRFCESKSRDSHLLAIWWLLVQRNCKMQLNTCITLTKKNKYWLSAFLCSLQCWPKKHLEN